MIRTLRIERLRGIREGAIDDLSPLTILLGPNGCGKSTIIDALLIATSSSTDMAIIRAVTRRRPSGRAARWLLWRGGVEGAAGIELLADTGEQRRCGITLSSPIRLQCSVETRRTTGAIERFRGEN